MTFVQVAEHNPPIKKKRGTRTLFSRQTYPLKITKGQTIPRPDTSQNLHLVDIRHNAELSESCRCYGCRWHLKLKHLNLLLKGGDHRYPLLKLEVLILVGVLEVYDHVGMLVHHRTSGI
jgi:hypothetical protein